MYKAGISFEKLGIEYQTFDSMFERLLSPTIRLNILKKVDILTESIEGSKLGAFYLDKLHDNALAEVELLKESKLILEHSQFERKGQLLEKSSQAAQNQGSTMRALNQATLALQYEPYNSALAMHCNELAKLLPHDKNTKLAKFIQPKTNLSMHPSISYNSDESEAPISLIQNAEILEVEPNCTVALISSALCYTELKNTTSRHPWLRRCLLKSRMP